MKTLISADELAKDVAGAEALQQRHRERKVKDVGWYGDEGWNREEGLQRRRDMELDGF